MRIFISGGSGFIGGRLAQHLSEAGYSITIGTRKNIKSIQKYNGSIPGPLSKRASSMHLYISTSTD